MQEVVGLVFPLGKEPLQRTVFGIEEPEPIAYLAEKRKALQAREGRQEYVGSFHLQVVQFFYLIGDTRFFEQFLPFGIGVGRTAFGVEVGRIYFVVKRRTEFHHFGKQLLGEFAGDAFGFPAFYQLQEDVANVARKIFTLFQGIDVGGE